MPEQGIVAAQVPGLPAAYANTQPSFAGMPGMVRPIALGDLINGTLQTGDSTTDSGSLADDYVVILTAGVPATFVARGGSSTTSPGSTLDMYLYLLRDGVELAHDDDSAASGGALNSRIVYTPPVSGPHVIRVSTFGSGIREGSYTLQTYLGALPTQL